MHGIWKRVYERGLSIPNSRYPSQMKGIRLQREMCGWERKVHRRTNRSVKLVWYDSNVAISSYWGMREKIFGNFPSHYWSTLSTCQHVSCAATSTVKFQLGCIPFFRITSYNYAERNIALFSSMSDNSFLNRIPITSTLVVVFANVVVKNCCWMWICFVGALRHPEDYAHFSLR